MTPSEAARVVRELYEVVWTSGELAAVDRLVAPEYVIHSDPGDPWEGRTLDRATYRERVLYSRTGFPDLAFAVHDLIAAEHRVCVRWSAEGIHGGDLVGLPATGKRLRFTGQTIYDIIGGLVGGHRQAVDRLGFLEQLRAGGA